jgi:hypothetical protein
MCGVTLAVACPHGRLLHRLKDDVTNAKLSAQSGRVLCAAQDEQLPQETGCQPVATACIAEAYFGWKKNIPNSEIAESMFGKSHFHPCHHSVYTVTPPYWFIGSNAAKAM